jgi:prephenate dehydrogenase
VTNERTANVIGLGLIGGSIATGLRQRGWRVHGEDTSAATVDAAVERGVIDAAGLDPEAAITFVAVPVLAVVDEVKRALVETNGVVTDVGSVKSTVAAL